MVLTVSFVISLVTGLCCHHRLADTSARLDASVGASGPYDFAVRVSAVRQKRCPRPPHPLPYVRDDRETPLCLGGDGCGCRGDLGQRGMEIFLRGGLDEWNQIETVRDFCRMRIYGSSRVDHRRCADFPSRSEQLNRLYFPLRFFSRDRPRDRAIRSLNFRIKI
jgi:hypothetical protein